MERNKQLHTGNLITSYVRTGFPSVQLIRIKRIDGDSKDHILKLLVTVKRFIARGHSTKSVLLKQKLIEKDGSSPEKGIKYSM